MQWSDLGSEGHLIKVGTQLGQAALLFDKIEDEAMDIQRAKLVKPKPVPTYPEHLEPMLDSITFDQFAPLDIRVATVTAAEAVPKADRLLKLTLDTGLDTRTVLSGIAEHFSPEEVVGKEVCVLVNLAPRKIRGIESQGMVLMAEDAKSGKLRFVSPSESVAPGSKVS